MYRNNPKYWDWQSWANRVDPDQTPQNATVYHLSSIWDVLKGIKMDCLKFRVIVFESKRVLIVRING